MVVCSAWKIVVNDGRENRSEMGESQIHTAAPTRR